MFEIRKSTDRGHAHHGWLESQHTFSFAGYHDPDYMGFRALRVINEDRVAPGKGFDAHSHRDMEILSYVLDGALEHRDSMGNGSVIRPGELQLMRAGTGVTHSEYNHSSVAPVHFLQIWILPDQEGLEPGYDQRAFAESERRGAFRLIASPDGAEGSVRVHQDVRLHATLLEPGQTIRQALDPDRFAWLQVTRGALDVSSGLALSGGDGLAVAQEPAIELTASAPTEALLFDLG
jgi:redox-sensitive bicupin YhaK (pirin superfamily)